MGQSLYISLQHTVSQTRTWTSKLYFLVIIKITPAGKNNGWLNGSKENLPLEPR